MQPPQNLDELRAAFPALGFALYAYEPNGAVALEIINPENGEVLQLQAESEAAVLALLKQPEEDIFA